jgi:hypothetical protein
MISILLTPFTRLRYLLSSLPYDEDFGVILLRAGTQSLEAAAGRGWRNEVAGVYAGGQYFSKFGLYLRRFFHLRLPQSRHGTRRRVNPQEDEDEGDEADELYSEDGSGPMAGQNEVLAL